MANTSAPTTTTMIQRKLASLRSCLTDGCSMRPSGWRIVSSAMLSLPFARRRLLVQATQVNGLGLVLVGPRQQGVALQLVEEIRQPQSADGQRRQKVHPVLVQG